MGCWYHAKKIQVSDYEPDESDDEYGGEDEGVAIEYMVADHEEGDQILIDTHGNDQVSPELALQVASAILKVDKWSRSKAGKKEIERLRNKHEEAEQERLAKRAAKKAAEDGVVA